MLVNPTLRRDFVLDQILTMIGQGGEPTVVQEGIIITPSFSIGNDIVGKKDDYPDFNDNYEYGPYGVCDNIEQVLERYKQWLDDPDRKFCISFTKVTKAEEPEQWGWRWHKWGKYIGTKNPQQEYLYDEDDSIQEVYCYHIYELLD